MKKYIRSDSDNIIDVLPIEIEIVIPEGIYAAVEDLSDQRFYDERDDLVMSLYENLIDDICTVCEMNGLELLYFDDSKSKNPDGTPSNSRYYDFCMKNQKQSGNIEVVFMLRVTDHRQTNKRRDGSDRKASLTKRRDERLAAYQKEQEQLNPNAPKKIYPYERQIKIGKTVCRTYGEAIGVLEQYIDGYADSVASRTKK